MEREYSVKGKRARASDSLTTAAWRPSCPDRRRMSPQPSQASIASRAGLAAGSGGLSPPPRDEAHPGQARPQHHHARRFRSARERIGDQNIDREDLVRRRLHRRRQYGEDEDVRPLVVLLLLGAEPHGGEVPG